MNGIDLQARIVLEGVEDVGGFYWACEVKRGRRRE